jgi:hypothetical protein
MDRAGASGTVLFAAVCRIGKGIGSERRGGVATRAEDGMALLRALRAGAEARVRRADVRDCFFLDNVLIFLRFTGRFVGERRRERTC